MKLTKTIGCILLALALGSAETFAQERSRVAVLDFEFASIQRWWEGNWDIGSGIADMIVEELVNDGTYSVIERTRLDAILAEQDFSNSDRANPLSAAAIGRILGVDAIVIGSVTQFGMEREGRSVGGLGRLTRGLVNRVGQQRGKAAVQLTARMVNTDSAEILVAGEGEGRSDRSGLLLAAGGGTPLGWASLSMTSSNYRETIMGEATEAAVEQLTGQLVRSSGRITARVVRVSGLVADVDGATLVLNVGSAVGVKVGDTLRILRVTRTITDPATGAILREITQELGQLRIDEVDAGSSLGTVITGSGIQVGDQVRN